MACITLFILIEAKILIQFLGFCPSQNFYKKHSTALITFYIFVRSSTVKGFITFHMFGTSLLFFSP